MPLRTAVLTISDSRSRGEKPDLGGPAVVDMLAALDAVLVHRDVVPDEVGTIRAAVEAWLGRCDLIVTTGGTGVAPRDVTPDALGPLIERSLPGFGEVMRLRGFEANPLSVASRSGAGIARGTLVLWLPGSPRGVRECLEWLAPAIRHVAALLHGTDAGH
ncbi:MAG: Molybdopterin adenylyltransferase [Phycisphaerae bacterium]|nr:Molybdopterin adenylyltransferase [Phycisphaerae bacterium]